MKIKINPMSSFVYRNQQTWFEFLKKKKKKKTCL